MKFSIPDGGVFDERDVKCFRVMWPDTPFWRSILAGLLYLPARGRTWDGRTGSIITARDSGASLFYRNVPLTECYPESTGGGEGETENSAPGPGGCCGEDEEGCDMACITHLTIEDGALYAHYGACCKVRVGDLSAFTEGTNITPEVPPGYQPGNTAIEARCAKADYISYVLWDMAEKIGEYVQNPISSALAMGALYAGYPWVSFDPVDLLLAITVDGINDILLGEFFEDVDAIDREQLRCAFYGIFDDTWAISDDEFKSMKSVLKQALPLPVDGFFHALIDAVGPGDWNKFGQRAATWTTETDCSCPEVELPPNIPGFAVSTLTYDFSIFSPNTTTLHDVPLTGTAAGTQWVAAVFDWEGQAPGNGEAYAKDNQTLAISRNTAPFSGSFAYYDTSVGQGLLSALHPGVPAYAAAEHHAYTEGTMSVEISGNNVTVPGSGTITLYFQLTP